MSRGVRLFAVEPEPEGGEELSADATIPHCRVKRMRELPDVKSKDGRPAYQFWLSAEVDGTLIKEIRTQVLKDASKKANFPGFRKGQVPPYAQPQITSFSLKESIIKTVQAAMDAYGLQTLPGSDGELNVNESVEEMTKAYKIVGESIQFTGTVNAAMDPAKSKDRQLSIAPDDVKAVVASDES